MTQPNTPGLSESTKPPARPPNALRLTTDLIRQAKEYANAGQNYPTFGVLNQIEKRRTPTARISGK